MSTRRNGFIAAGCWTLDHVKLISSWPAEEELRNITALEQQGGGSGYNFGVDIKKLDSGMPVQAIGLLGEDEAGDFLQSQAAALGIDTRQLHRSSHGATAFTDVLTVSSSGRRTFFHYSGCNDLLNPDHFDFSHSSARWLHLGLPGVHKVLDAPWQDDANGWVSVLKKAQQAGLRTNLEMVSIAAQRNRELCLPCLPYLDCLIVNDHEIGSLAGMQTLAAGQTCRQSCLQAALSILQRSQQSTADGAGLQLVVVHFPEGAVCVSSSGEQWQRESCQVDPDTIVSAVGAGDAFAAGMLYALHQQWPIVAALDLAHATAAASLRSATTVGAVEDVNSVLALAGLKRPDPATGRPDTHSPLS